MTRSQWHSRGVLVGLALSSVVMAGCKDDGVAVTDSTRRVVTRLAAGEHEQIIRNAESLYDYGEERQTITVDDTAFKGPIVDEGGIPQMTIATATLKPNAQQPPQRLIARIRSQGAYPQVGIQPGYNYVWRNSWDSKAVATWVTRIIPRDSAIAYDLIRDSRLHEFTKGMSPEEPRLVILKVHSIALALCLDDPMCPTGHCGYY